MSQVFSIKIGNNVLSPADWTSTDNLYSTVEIGAGSQPDLVAFAYGRGGVVPGSPTQRKADPIDTNLEGEGGRLPENEALLCYAMSIDLFLRSASGTDDDNVQAPDLGFRNVGRLQHDVLIELVIANLKVYAQAPLGYFPAGMGLFSTFASGVGGNLATGYTAGSNGGTSVKAVRRFAAPQFIKGGETFQVRYRFPNGQVTGLNFGTPGSPDDRVIARTYLRGYRKRPVA